MHGGEHLRERIKRIFQDIDESIDIILIKNANEQIIDENFFYFTGLEKGLFEGCILLLYRDGRKKLVVSELEADLTSNTDIQINIFKKKQDIIDFIESNIKSSTNIGLNFNRLSYNDYIFLKNTLKTTKFTDISKEILKTRSIKDDFEIDLIKKACNISDKVMNIIPSIVKEGMFEYELAAEIDYLMQKNGADKPAFDTISSFGRNTAYPHYTHGNSPLKKGDLIICDFGANHNRYNSDITRTFVFGNASTKQKRMHEIVFNAQKIGFDLIKQGVIAKDVHKSVEEYINKSEFKDHFIHSTGHSLGLLVHDGNIGLNQSSENKLLENMVLTVEPGIYVQELGGIRIEDDVVVKKDGIELITKPSRELIEI